MMMDQSQNLEAGKLTDIDARIAEARRKTLVAMGAAAATAHSLKTCCKFAHAPRSPGMSTLTIFDKILKKEIPAQSVYEDEFVFAFRDIQPQAPVHVLVIPKKKWVRFSELKDAEPLAVGEFFTRIAKVAHSLGLDTNGYRVVLNNGRDGQQTVDYIHAHILGGRGLTWPPG